MACKDCAPERNNPCPDYPNANCVVYSGANLTCLGVKTNDRLSAILAKIDEAVCSISPEVEITMSNLGTGEGIFTQEVGGDYQFKSLVNGSGILLSSTPDEITIDLDTSYIDANFWSLNGNSGTNEITNFIGTTDAMGIRFRLNNNIAGRLDYYDSTPEEGSVALGYNALSVMNEVGGPYLCGSVAIGPAVLKNNTYGENVAVGIGAMKECITAWRNTVMGEYAMAQGWAGNHNAFFGVFTGEVNSGSSYNTGIGSESLRGNKQGDNNSALGSWSLRWNSTVVDSITVTNGGSGYTTATVTISAPEGGTAGAPSTQATATATINAGVITGITVTNKGKGYSSEKTPVTVTITGDGVGATATAVLKSGKWNTGVGAGSFWSGRANQYCTGVGMWSGVGAGGNEASDIDEYCTFIGYNASRSGSLAASTPLSKSTAIGYNAKVAIDKAIVLGATGSDQPNIGIGTASPTDTLHIVGTFRYQDGNEQNGYILTSDIDGVASWQAAPATYTDEEAQDAVGNILTDGNGFNFDYDDAIPQITLTTSLTQNSVPFIGVSGALTEDNTKFYYSNDNLNINGVQIGRGINNVSTDIVIGTSSRAAVGGGFNTFIGHENYTTGTSSYNVALGYRAFRLGNTSGGSSTAIGAQSLYNLVGGGFNLVAVGTNALYSNNGTSIAGKGHNTAVGGNSGFNLTTGEFNTFLGAISGNNIRLGHHNTVIGQGAMGLINPLATAYDISYNTAVGSGALYISQGNYNTTIGYLSGSAITTGNYNVILGNNTGSSIATLDNNIIISDGQGNLRLSFDNTGVGYLQTVNNDNTEDKLLTWNSTSKAIEYRDVSTISVTETDPVFLASAAAGITGTDITNWNTAFGWGNHASAGYALDANVVHLTGNESVGGTKTFTSDIILPDEAYGIGWNGSLEAPTKNAIYDKIESLGTGWGLSGNSITGTEYIGTNNNYDLSFYTNGIERMRLNSSGGELLIGTTTDNGDYKLQVNGNSYLNGNIVNNRTLTTVADQISIGSGALKIGVTNTTSARIGVSTWDGLHFDVNGVGDAMVINASGTTIKGDIVHQGDIYNNFDVGMYRLHKYGFASIVTEPTYSFYTDPNTGMFWGGADAIGFTTNGTAKMYIRDAEFSINENGLDYDVRIEGDTDPYLLFTDASTDRIGIGTNSPSAFLHIKAGTTTSAPLKFTAGTNLTAAEAGAIEFNGTNLFYTTSTPARKTIANLDDAQTFASDISVPDDAYDATSWNGNFEVPTKNAIRDKIESLSAGSGITRTVVITSGSATMGSSAATDYVYFVSGAHTMSLPAAAGNTNRYTVKNNHSANITIDTTGAENIEGAASISIAPAESVDIISDGTDWYII